MGSAGSESNLASILALFVDLVLIVVAFRAASLHTTMQRGTDLAGRLVVLEALTGQLFLATFLARLVALFGQRRRPSTDR